MSFTGIEGSLDDRFWRQEQEAPARAIDHNKTEESVLQVDRPRQAEATRRSPLLLAASWILVTSAIGALALTGLMLNPTPKRPTITIEFRAFGKSYAVVGSLADPRALERLGLNAEAQSKQNRL
jgi:hypothetical protein